MVTRARAAASRTRSASTSCAEAIAGSQLKARKSARRFITLFSRFLNLDDAQIAVHHHPVARLDQIQWVAIEIRHARHAHHYRSERNLRRHLIEDERLWCRSRQPCRVIHRRPARRSLGATKNEHLVLEALASQLVVRFCDDTLLWVDAAPAGNRFARHERFPFGAA